MRKWLLSIEWALLIGLGMLIVPTTLSFENPLRPHPAVQEAKRNGTFYPGSEEKQTYFGKRIEMEGFIYDGGDELTVLLKGCRFGPHGKLPTRAYLRLDDGRTIAPTGGGSSAGSVCMTGSFTYRNVPPGRVEMRNEAYGESFAFVLQLGKGKGGAG
ncbi:hypothetical protein MO973_11675 [Paenibacillus sp. TRM 82003]|nr:hypothetical protein [Paenibacillus sp. TRM 82003]